MEISHSSQRINLCDGHTALSSLSQCALCTFAFCFFFFKNMTMTLFRRNHMSLMTIIRRHLGRYTLYMYCA